jgi:immune inhibitor A
MAGPSGIDSGDAGPNVSQGDDILPNPLAEKQRALRQAGLEMKLNGDVEGHVAQIGEQQYAELAQIQTDRVFVVLAEFGEQIDSKYGGSAGPAHNEIAEPVRPRDNTTIWQADYDQQHYEDLYFSSAPGALSMVNYYAEQSSGRYTIDGEVTDWVKVPYNEARYGADYCGDSVCATTWDLIRDAIDIWTQDQIDSGMTFDEVQADLASFDLHDRYDYDGDGNFDEPDGYIDHFQIVHAGQGEETGGGDQGSDAIWSHRWYAYYPSIGSDGPSYNLAGGTEFGDTDVWVGDYTIQPENGGLGVFAHEYAHDLGLPDEYDTNPQVLGLNDHPFASESPVGFWSLMARGSYLNDGRPKNGIGGKPADMTAWDKFQLGWLTYDVVRTGDLGLHDLAPASSTDGQTQAVIVVLPNKQRDVSVSPDPFGEYAWWSGMGDNINHLLTKAVTLPSDATRLTFKTYYDIEKDWDYAYVSYSLDNGDTWTNLAGNITTNSNPNGQNFGNGITGRAKSNGWTDASFNIRSIAGQSALLRFRYWTDGAVTVPASSSTTSESGRRAEARNSSGMLKPRILAGQLMGSSARLVVRRAATSTPTSPSSARTRGSMRRCAPARTTSASSTTPTARTTSSICHIRMACSFTTGIPRSWITTSASIPVRGSSCQSTRIHDRCIAPMGFRGAPACRCLMRPSVWKQPIL